MGVRGKGPPNRIVFPGPTPNSAVLLDMHPTPNPAVLLDMHRSSHLPVLLADMCIA